MLAQHALSQATEGLLALHALHRRSDVVPKCGICCADKDAKFSVLGLVELPMLAAPFASLALTSLIFPQASFLGHLSGIAVGLLVSTPLVSGCVPVSGKTRRHALLQGPRTHPAVASLDCSCHHGLHAAVPQGPASCHAHILYC